MSLRPTPYRFWVYRVPHNVANWKRAVDHSQTAQAGGGIGSCAASLQRPADYTEGKGTRLSRRRPHPRRGCPPEEYDGKFNFRHLHLARDAK